MRRTARLGVGAGALAGVAGAFVAARRKVHSRREAKRKAALAERRDLWPPVPVKPGAHAQVSADRAGARHKNEDAAAET